jgi:uncharacterized protein YjbI with pentapeptide repeats
MQGKVAEETAKQFVEEVKDKVRQFNQHKTRLQVLVSGRELVVQANRSKFREPHQILHVLSYFMTKEERKNRNKNYLDVQDCLEQDQRQLWWQYYGKAKGKEYSGLPPELDKPNLVEITAQPLLNYLVALSIERDKLQFSEETNLNEIYADLLDAVYERGYEKHGYRLTEGIEKDEFIGILEEIALACWHGDGRTTTVREIETHCENSGLKDILNRFQESFNEDSKASVTRLLTAFYFRESGGVRESEKTFEFTHKSFGEYLTAKRIVLGVRLIHEELEERKINFRKGCDERTALVNWATLCGPSAIDEYLFRFICDEMRLHNSLGVGNWQKTLCRLIEFMLVNGMPMEGLKHRPDFQEEMRQARNAEEALLAVLNACARVTREISEIKWFSPEAFGAWISRLQVQGKNVRSSILLQCLSFLNLENCKFIAHQLWGANFEESNLSGVEFILVSLIQANLAGTNLAKALLAGADLQEANLVGANLSEANLGIVGFGRGAERQTNLSGAILARANLRGANFGGVNLKEANLREANLEETNWRKVNLDGANLQGTILEGKDIASLHDNSNEGSDES